MWRYKRFLYIKRRFIVWCHRFHKLQKIRDLNYRFLTYKNLEHHYMIYRIKPRNKIVSFVHRYMYIIWMKSYNSIIPFKGRYVKWFFWHLFIEIAAYHLILYRWEQFGVWLRGKYRSFMYFYRYLVYVYKMCGKRFPQIDHVKVIVTESFSSIRKKKYPRRKRRFKRAI